MAYAPEPTGTGPYSAELAQQLSLSGHAIRVVTAFPFYPAWRSEVPPGTFLYRSENRDGIDVTRCRVYVPRKPRLGRRLAHELSWLLSAAPQLPRLAAWADVWVAVTPSFGSAILGAVLSRALGARVHLHVQDIVPDVAVESGQLGSGVTLRLARRVARWTYRSFSSVSVLSEAMGARLSVYRDARAATALVAPNWVRRGGNPAGRLPDALSGRPYALYAGSFGRKQDLALLTQAAALLSARSGPTIAVLGEGPGREAVEGVRDGLVWLGLLDDASYRAVLEHAIAGIVALAPGVGDSVVPSKLAGYLGAGRPVVVAADVNSEAARVVDRAKCGFRIPPGRADMLADRLCSLTGNTSTWHAFSAAAREFASAEWDKETIVRRVETALFALARNGTNGGPNS